MVEVKKEEKTVVKSEKNAKKETKKNTTKIAKCTCKSEFQDKQYGMGMRVKNSTAKGFKCTVCGATN